MTAQEEPRLEDVQTEAKQIEAEMRDAAMALDVDKVLAFASRYRAVQKQLIAAVEKSIADAIHAGIDSVDYKALTGQDIICITWTVDASGAETLLINPEQVGHSTGWESRSGKNRAGTSNRTHQRIGPRLLREHGLPALKGYFSKTGEPYARPSGFPSVLFDTNGYLMVNDEASMLSNPYINVGKRISVPNGIDSVPGYATCGHTHE